MRLRIFVLAVAVLEALQLATSVERRQLLLLVEQLAPRAEQRVEPAERLQEARDKPQEPTIAVRAEKHSPTMDPTLVPIRNTAHKMAHLLPQVVR
jgi:hypothetical protein